MSLLEVWTLADKWQDESLFFCICTCTVPCCFLYCFCVLFFVNMCSYYFVRYHRRPALMGLRLLWQPAIAVIVTHDDCVVVFWQINSLSLSLSCRIVQNRRLIKIKLNFRKLAVCYKAQSKRNVDSSCPPPEGGQHDLNEIQTQRDNIFVTQNQESYGKPLAQRMSLHLSVLLLRRKIKRSQYCNITT